MWISCFKSVFRATLYLARYTFLVLNINFTGGGEILRKTLCIGFVHLLSKTRNIAIFQYHSCAYIIYNIVRNHVFARLSLQFYKYIHFCVTNARFSHIMYDANSQFRLLAKFSFYLKSVFLFMLPDSASLLQRIPLLLSESTFILRSRRRRNAGEQAHVCGTQSAMISRVVN